MLAGDIIAFKYKGGDVISDDVMAPFFIEIWILTKDTHSVAKLNRLRGVQLWRSFIINPFF